MAINYGRKYFDRVLIFRPHNVYGPDMGWEHVIPQFALRLKQAAGAATLPARCRSRSRATAARPAASAMSTTSCAGVMVMRAKGEHLGIYHVGTTEEFTIGDVARRIAAHAGRDIELVRLPAPAGGTDAALPGHRASSRSSAMRRRCRSRRACRRPWTGTGRNEGLAPKVLIRHITVASEEIQPCSRQKLPAPPAPAASVPVECCQICGNDKLETVLSLGYMPPVNQMVPIGQVPRQQPWFPTDAAATAGECELVQLGLAVDPVIIFPPEYPYTSGMTRILRDNFAELYAESSKMLGLTKDDLAVDIGSNDGTLISNFQKGGHRILGIEPTDVGQDRHRARHPDLAALFRQGSGARGEGKARRREGRHRGELLRPYRGRARDRRRRHRDAGARRRLHFGIALPDRPAGQPAIRHRLSRAPAVLLGRQPRAPARHARP